MVFFSGKTGSPLQLAQAANLPEICELLEAALASQKEKKHHPAPVVNPGKVQEFWKGF
jgi:hypothetical protein